MCVCACIHTYTRCIYIFINIHLHKHPYIWLHCITYNRDSARLIHKLIVALPLCPDSQAEAHQNYHDLSAFKCTWASYVIVIIPSPSFSHHYHGCGKQSNCRWWLTYVYFILFSAMSNMLRWFTTTNGQWCHHVSWSGSRYRVRWWIISSSLYFACFKKPQAPYFLWLILGNYFNYQYC